MEGDRPSMTGRIVGGSVLPTTPENADPGAGEDADGVGMVAASIAGVAVDGSGPGIGMTGVVGPGGEGATQALVAGEAAGDAAMLAGGPGDGGDAGFGGELVGRGEAEAVVAELGEDLGGIDGAGPGEGLEERAVRMLGEEGGDEAVELTDVGEKGRRQATRDRTSWPLVSRSRSPARPRGAERRRSRSSSGVRRPQ